MSCSGCSLIRSLEKSFHDTTTFISQSFQNGIQACQHAPQYWTEEVKKGAEYWNEQIQNAPAYWKGQIVRAPSYWKDEFVNLVACCLINASKLVGIDVRALEGRVKTLETLNKQEQETHQQMMSESSRKATEDQQSLATKVEDLARDVDSFKTKALSAEELVQTLRKDLERKEIEMADQKKANEKLAAENISLKKSVSNLNRQLSKASPSNPPSRRISPDKTRQSSTYHTQPSYAHAVTSSKGSQSKTSDAGDA